MNEEEKKVANNITCGKCKSENCFVATEGCKWYDSDNDVYKKGTYVHVWCEDCGYDNTELQPEELW